MSYVLGLKCKECGHRVPVSPVHVCEQCFGPYEVEYDYARMKGKVTRESIARGPKSLWRYKDLLPVEGTPKTGQFSGFTPLKKAERLGRELGCRDLWIKDDSCNYPTYSYKERVVSVAISKAMEFGFDTVGCASTGNLANSTAAHAAQAGLRCFVMIPHDLEQGKVLGSLIFGPTMVRVRGNYDDVNRLCTEIADKYRWAIVNVNLRPYYTEGAKTHGFEIAEQFGWRLPQHTVVPTAGGTILPKVFKAYREFIELGLVQDNKPRIYSAQAAGCNPVVTAIHKGVDIIEPQKPNTIAKSIAIGNPADGYYVWHTIKESGGWGESATDREIIDAIKLLARTEGIWTEPAGGTTLAVTMKLLQQGRIPRDESIVVSITGNGLKTLETVQNDLTPPPVIEAKLADFDRLLAEQEKKANSEAPAAPRGRGIIGRGLILEETGGMMSVKVRIPSPLRNFTQGSDIVETEGVSVGEVLNNLKNKAAGIETRLFKGPNQLNRFVNVYLNDEDIRHLWNLETPVKAGDEISIVPAIAGGAR